MNKSSKKIQPQSAKTPFDVLIGRAAMLGFVLAFGSYLTADALVPGLI